MIHVEKQKISHDIAVAGVEQKYAPSAVEM